MLLTASKQSKQVVLPKSIKTLAQALKKSKQKNLNKIMTQKTHICAQMPRLHNLQYKTSS